MQEEPRACTSQTAWFMFFSKATVASIMSRALPHLLWGWLLPVLKSRCGLCIGFASSGGTGRPELLLGQAEDEVGQALRSCNISAESEVLRGFLLVRNGLWQLLLMAGNTGTSPLARFDCWLYFFISKQKGVSTTLLWPSPSLNFQDYVSLKAGVLNPPAPPPPWPSWTSTSLWLARNLGSWQCSRKWGVYWQVNKPQLFL